MRVGLIAAACLVVGLVGGFAVGRWWPAVGPPGPPPVTNLADLLEQKNVLTIVDDSGPFEVFYARPFASPPALEVLDDNPTKPGALPAWGYKITEQRADGFKLTVSLKNGGAEVIPLRYVARGLPAQGK